MQLAMVSIIKPQIKSMLMVTGIILKETEPYSTALDTKYGLAQVDIGARPKLTAATLQKHVVHSSTQEGQVKETFQKSIGGVIPLSQNDH